MTLEGATILLAGMTFLLAVTTVLVTAFQDTFRAWVRHPMVTLATEMQPPEAHKTVLARAGGSPAQTDCYYFLLRVENVGNARAENVEVFAKRLLEKCADKSYRPVEGFLPMNLILSFSEQPVLPSLPPGLHKHWTLGHVINPRQRNEFPGESHPDLRRTADAALLTTFVLDVQFRSNTLCYFLRPGSYQLELAVGAGNAKSSSWVLDLELTGSWFDAEKDMFAKGIWLALRRQ
jgi:Na+-transporting methylmalonyl-CoA/oxaloacetate decarboxylase gamma subunit